MKKIKSAEKNSLKNAICPDGRSTRYRVITGLVLQHKVPIQTKSKPRLLAAIVHPISMTVLAKTILTYFQHHLLINNEYFVPVPKYSFVPVPKYSL